MAAVTSLAIAAGRTHATKDHPDARPDPHCDVPLFASWPLAGTADVRRTSNWVLACDDTPANPLTDRRRAE